jgi:hypothetical protein
MVVAAKIPYTSGYVINAESHLNMDLMAIFTAHVAKVKLLLSSIGATVKSMVLHLFIIPKVHLKTTLIQ